MRAVFWTAIGSLLIPLGVVLAIELPSARAAGFWLIVAGSISMVAGWVYTIRQERRDSRESELRIRREKSTIILLVHMAEQLGVDMDKLAEKMKERLDER